MDHLLIKEKPPVHPPLAEVRMEDAFFSRFMKNLEEKAAWDILEKFKKDGALENYRRVIRKESGTHDGPPWSHGLICECIRGISDLLRFRYDAKLDRELDEIIALIAGAAATDPEGYVNPYTTLVCPQCRYGRNGGNCLHQHETYNAGALCEAGVHHYLATGKLTLLQVAITMWNGLASFIGEAPRHEVTTEHSLPEEALLKLAQLLEADAKLCAKLGGEPTEYRRLASYFVNGKGRHEERYSFPPYLGEYSQDHRPAREQRFAVGHAVRATLFYTGMAAVAAADKDKELGEAALAIWRDITETKLHANGCVGSLRAEEKFGSCYQLPNNAYLETCAGIGFAFFGYRLSELYPDSSIYDELEGTLRNLLPVSISDTYDRYTYENPLVSTGEFERWSWHKCPCCPPMLLKITGMLPQFIYQGRGQELYVNLYLDSTWSHDSFSLTQQSKRFVVSSTAGDNVPFRFYFRVPRYAEHFAVYANGKKVDTVPENGYAVLEAPAGTEITVSFDEAILKYAAHPYVKDDRNRIMVKRGAMLYCIEEVDQPWAFENGRLTAVLDGTAPLAAGENGEIFGTDTNGRKLTFTPYYQWNNRKKGAMAVWITDSTHKSDPCHPEAFGQNLYMPIARY